MIALLPVSGWIAKTMHGVQTEKMKAVGSVSLRDFAH